MMTGGYLFSPTLRLARRLLPRRSAATARQQAVAAEPLVRHCFRVANRTKYGCISYGFPPSLKFRGSEISRPSSDLGLRVFGGVCAQRGKPHENSPHLGAGAPPKGQNFSSFSSTRIPTKVRLRPANLCCSVLPTYWYCESLTMFQTSRWESKDATIRRGVKRPGACLGDDRSAFRQ
jgi:hypothetical protein